MGLYSLNRVAGLTENAYINKSLIESMDDSNNFTETSLLEVSQIITEHENKMFNTLIELDFVSAMNEAEEAKAEEKKDDAPADDKKEAKSEADDAKKKNIFKKAKELLEKVWNAIKNAFLTFADKIRVLLNNDKKIVEKYVPALEKLSNEDFANYGKEFEYYDGELAAPNFNIMSIASQVHKDDVDEWIKNFKEKCDNFKTGKLNKDIVGKAIAVVKGKLLDGFKKTAKAVTTNADNVLKSTDEKDNLYQLAVAQAKAAKEGAAIFVNTAKRILADDRKILIIAGKWALSGKRVDEKRENLKKKGEEQEHEDSFQAVSDSFDFALAEASDLYVMECLEF